MSEKKPPITGGTFEGVPYVAVGNGECSTCDELLKQAFDTGDGSKLIEWQNHINTEHMKKK